MKSREAGIAAYLDFLQSLRESGDTYFVEGGQAVNYWAEYIDAVNPGHPLEMLRPFTSKDCDVWINHTTWELSRTDPNKKALFHSKIQNPKSKINNQQSTISNIPPSSHPAKNIP